MSARMIQSVRHLHEAKVDEIAEKLRREGYVVRRGLDAGDDEFDLVGEKDGRKLAVEVKDAVGLRASAKDVVRLRQLAAEKGFNDFRVFVVNPPRQKRISVWGLEAVLFNLASGDPPEQLKSLSDRTVVQRVHGVEVDSVAIQAGDVHVSGSAVAVVELSYGEEGGDNPLALVAEFPIHFDLRLNSDLTLRERVSLVADTASFTGP